MVCCSITQRDQVRFACMYMSNQMRIARDQRLRIFLIYYDSSGIQVQSNWWVSDLLHDSGRCLGVCHEIALIACGIRFQANHQPLRLRNVTETLEELGCSLLCLPIGKSRAIPIFWRPEDQPGCA